MVSLLDKFNEWLNPKPKRTYVNLRDKREQDLMKVHLLAKFGKMFALLLALSVSASAAPLVGAQFRDFSGALNDSTDPTALPPNQSPDLLNLVVDDPVGAAKPRNGFTQCGKLPSGNTPTELYNYSKTDGTQYLIVADNTNVYQTGDCSTWTRIATGQSSTNKPNFATVRNNLWFVNGSTNPYVWDGATTTVMGGSAGSPAPAPPRARYIAYWHERVWLAYTSGLPSLLQWSALTDAAGNDLDPSTGTLSWPATNAVYVDRDGGSPIYGIKPYRDNLYVFKGNGIWRIAFNSDFDVAIVKTLSSVGCRFNSSIVELDNLLYFVGPDGIYSFDGDNSVRLSDKIYQKFLALRQPLTAENIKIWTNQSDFAAGTVAQTTATVTLGSVQLSTQNGLIPNGGFEDSTFDFWRCVVISSAGVLNACGRHPVQTYFGNPALDGSYSGYVQTGINTTGHIAGYKVIGVDGSTKTVQNSLGTNLSPTTTTINSASYAGSIVYLVFTAAGDSNYLELWSSTFTAGTEIIFNSASNAGGNYSGVWQIDNVKSLRYYSTGTWTSDVYQAVSISSWSSFDATDRSNGGSIAYSIRVASHPTALALTSWTPITAGSLIPGASWQNYVQLKATFTASSDLQNTPYLDDVSVSFLTGGSQTQTIYAGRWKNRYWVSATTGTAGTNDIVLVNSRYDKSNWVPYDLRVGPMVIFNDNFYAGASTHSAVYRMDYGTNDAGVSIPWYWTSRDEAWGQPLNRKRLMEISTDFRKASGASSVQIGYSGDNGVSYTNSTVNMSGTGRTTDTRYVNGQNKYDYRLRFGSTSLDVAPTIIGITGWVNIYPGRN